MPWCHHCKSEYVEGIERCADCGAPLQPGPPEPAAKRSRREALAQGVYQPVILLERAASPREADATEALLREAGIAVFRPGRTGAGNGAAADANLFVHVDQLEHARHLLDASRHFADDDGDRGAHRPRDRYPDADDEFIWPDDEDEYDGYVRESYAKRDFRRILSWIMLAVFLCGTLGYTVYTILSYVRR